MTGGRALQDRARASILDAAAAVFAGRGEGASLADIAQAAGVARSTLYRYFPSRDALLAALTDSGAREVDRRLTELRDSTIPVPEALARLTRALLAVGTKYVALTTLRPKLDDAADTELAGRLAQLFQRGIDEGTIRKDLDPEVLANIYGDLIKGAIPRFAGRSASVESTSALIVSLLLDGAKQ